MQKINPNLYTPIAIVIAGIVVAGAVLIMGRQGGGSAQTANTTQQPATIQNAAQIATNNDPMIGDPNAPLTIAYWFDYQCPFCRENEVNNMPQLIKDYIDTGKAKIVFKDFSFLGQDSQTLAYWARAVWAVAPNQFEAWHAAVFANQGQENTGWATTAEILKITNSVLSQAQTAQVKQLVAQNSTKYQSDMDADMKEGEQNGIQGTPAMIVGDQMVNGYESYAQIKSVVDSQLAAK